MNNVRTLGQVRLVSAVGKGDGSTLVLGIALILVPYVQVTSENSEMWTTVFQAPSHGVFYIRD